MRRILLSRVITSSFLKDGLIIYSMHVAKYSDLPGSTVPRRRQMARAKPGELNRIISGHRHLMTCRKSAPIRPKDNPKDITANSRYC